MQEKLKQLELLVMQTLSRLHALEAETKAVRQKNRQQEEALLRLKESENELKSLREWKKNTVAVLKRLEGRVEKELARAKEQEENLD